ELLLQLRRRRDLALAEQGDDLLLDRVADPVQARRQALLRELADRLGAVADYARGLLVGEHPVAVGAVQLVERPQLGEGGCDLGVAHRVYVSRRGSVGNRVSLPRWPRRPSFPTGSSCRPTTRPTTSRASSRPCS